MNPVSLIVKKRSGHTHAPEEIEALVQGFLRGDVADYQMSAWLMASLINGLNERETVALTDAMLHSGRILTMSSVKAAKVDKHSTGGVGDKISLCLAPLVAACGVAVPMISGRGLGHTGGTLDKLESIPGYDTRLDEKRFEEVVRKVGASIIGQTDKIAPADRAIYALRDVTGTVESIPLIVASILSKKLAAGIDALVLDVKVGRGAFMKNQSSAKELARALVRVGRRAGKDVRAVLTDMSSPIGLMIGNALEVREAIDVLCGGGPEDTAELTFELAADMVALGGCAANRTAGRAVVQKALDSGEALDRFRRMVEAHGGDPRVVEEPERLPTAPHRVAVTSTRGGFVGGVDALELARLAVDLGAGRFRADQDIDPAVGIELAVQVGQQIEADQPLAWLHVRSRRAGRQSIERARQAFSIGRERPKTQPRILGRITR